MEIYIIIDDYIIILYYHSSYYIHIFKTKYHAKNYNDRICQISVTSGSLSVS